MPDLDPDRINQTQWVYGDNKKVPEKIYHGKTKSLPVEQCYAVAQLNHYATRSRESFLVQSHRGNAVKLNEQADVKYWKRYNHNVIQGGLMARHLPALKELMSEWLSDPELRQRQDVCNTRHQNLIKTLKLDPDYAKLLKRVTRIDERARTQKEADA